MRRFARAEWHLSAQGWPEVECDVAIGRQLRGSLKLILWHLAHRARREMLQVRMNRACRQTAMRSRMNDCLGAIGDVTRREDAWSASCKRLGVDEQPAP